MLQDSSRALAARAARRPRSCSESLQATSSRARRTRAQPSSARPCRAAREGKGESSPRVAGRRFPPRCGGAWGRPQRCEVEAMTKKKDLKKRVRERQAKTGESYTAARAQVRKVHIEEAPNANDEARAEGFRGIAIVSRKLREARDLRPLFARLRELLLALEAPACGPLLRGESLPRRIPQVLDILRARRFLERVRAGHRGLSDDGAFFALSWNERTVVGTIILIRGPMLQMGLLEDADSPPELAFPLMGLGG